MVRHILFAALVSTITLPAAMAHAKGSSGGGKASLPNLSMVKHDTAPSTGTAITMTAATGK